MNPRAIARDLLDEVLRRKRPFDEVLAAHPDLDSLEPRDRGFVRLLVATVLRRLGQIDAILAACLDRPLKHKDFAAHDALRLGVAQLLFLGTPAHAAVAATVDVAPDHLRGLTNAVLRRLTREGAGMVEAQDAARLNLPAWLWQSWTKAYGEPTARTIAARLTEEPPLDLTAREPERWAEALEAILLPTGSLRREPAQVTALPGFEEGAWWVQDAAAALPARLLGPVDGLRVADLCAAPGGKTLQLAAAGARVTAIDRSEARLARLSENLARARLSAEVIAADAAAYEPAEPFDAVLLDAPCSATGTARRHPDVIHSKQPQDIAKLAALQDRLIRAALAMVKPGGLVVYCTCSLQPEEGPERIAAALGAGLGAGLGAERVPIRAEEVGGLAELLTGAGDLRTLPSHLPEQGGLDGFYAARLRRLA